MIVNQIEVNIFIYSGNYRLLRIIIDKELHEILSIVFLSFGF